MKDVLLIAAIALLGACAITTVMLIAGGVFWLSMYLGKLLLGSPMAGFAAFAFVALVLLCVPPAIDAVKGL